MRHRNFLLTLCMFLIVLVAIKQRANQHEDVGEQLVKFGQRRSVSVRPGLECWGRANKCKGYGPEDFDEVYQEMDRISKTIFKTAQDAHGDKHIVAPHKTTVKDLEVLGSSLLLRSLPSLQDSLLMEIVQVNAGIGGHCKSLTTFTTDPNFNKMELWYPFSRHAGLLVNGTYLQQGNRLIAISDHDLLSRNSPMQRNCGIPDAELRRLLPSLDAASKALEARGSHRSRVQAANEVLADISHESILGILILPSQVPYDEIKMIQQANTILHHHFGRPQRFGNVFALVDNKLMSITNKAEYDVAKNAEIYATTGGTHVIHPKPNRRIKAKKLA